jgi:2-polyprenyl-3-methyl-5-hydroxy-6-metoxy-1,4-benzoquinol methylase
MREPLLRLIMCPSCGGELRAESRGGTAEIEEGRLVCQSCGSQTPIRGGIPRFVEEEEYATAFGDEWTKWPRAQLDSATGLSESREKLQAAFTFPLTQLRRKVVADIGCGTGRFSEIALEEGAEVVCVDMTRAIDVAKNNLSHFENAHFVQADIFALPLRAEFDVVYSLGVLHHTPDARRAFERIVELLLPGGVIAIRLYAAYNKAYINTTEFYRRFTKKMSPRTLFKLSHIAIPMYYVNKVPGLGPFITRILIPVSVNPPTHAWRVCNTFDLYSPQYQSFHTHAEVNDWLLDAGLERVRVTDPDGGVCFEGWRSASGVGG